MAGYEVWLVAPHGADETRDGVRIMSVPRPKGRLERATRTAWRVFRRALALKADAYHLHDPELLPHGLLLKLMRKRVVYDAHEHLPKDMHSKRYLPAPLRGLFALVTDVLERAVGFCFDGIVTVTPGIAVRFPYSRTVLARNYPLRSEFPTSFGAPYASRKPVIIYLGGLNEIRGARQMVRAVGRLEESLGAELWLAGQFDPPALKLDLMKEKGWARTRHLGWLSREEVRARLAQARVGLLVLHPEPNFLDSLPIKLFEYMAAGLPVVASRFPAWEAVVEDAGLFVDPKDDAAIAEALRHLLTHPDEARARGESGRAAVDRTLHWEREAGALLTLYGRIVGPPRFGRGNK
jgi:glycosyltransferase involved in cell wall biosynthesis